MVKNVWNQNEEEIIKEEERDLQWKLKLSRWYDKETELCVPLNAMAFGILF